MKVVIVGGVAGGIADYIGVDSSLVRVVTALMVIFTGVGWLVYLVLWAVLPTDTSSRTGFDEVKDAFGKGTGGPAERPVQNPDDLR